MLALHNLLQNMPILQRISVGAPRLLVSSWMSAADPSNVTPAAQLR